MKRIKVLFTCILIGIIGLLTMPFSVSAASASASISGPGTVRAGDSITVTITMNLTNDPLPNKQFGVIYGLIKYDSSQLTLNSANLACAWGGTPNTSKPGEITFSSFDSSGTTSIKTASLTMKFTVRSLPEGTNIRVYSQSLQATAGSLMNISNVEYQKPISPPPSAENNLSSLTVSNGSLNLPLTPAFNENVTGYSAGTVPFTTTKLTVTAIPKDSKAKVSVSGDTLSVGANTVKVTVTAESGAIKIYTISVTREQDPNYVADTNNRISGIIIDGYVISPPFSKERTSYVVWLPYETTRITVSATAESGKSSIKIEGSNNLQVGDNEIRIICTAENGATQVYLLIARRAASNGSVEPGISPVSPNVDSNTGIQIVDTNRILEDDIFLSVTPINDSDVSLEDIADAFQLFNIKLMKGNIEVQPDGMIKVMIPLSEGYDGSKCKIYRIEPDGTRTDMNAECVVDSITQQKYMAFITDHFSLYAIVQLMEGKIKAPFNNMIFYIAMPTLLAGGFGAGVAVKGDRKKRRAKSTANHSNHNAPVPKELQTSAPDEPRQQQIAKINKPGEPGDDATLELYKYTAIHSMLAQNTSSEVNSVSTAPAKPAPAKPSSVETPSAAKPVLAEIAPTKAAQVQPAPAQSVPAETKSAAKPVLAEIAPTKATQAQPAPAKPIPAETLSAAKPVLAEIAPTKAAQSQPAPAKPASVGTPSAAKPAFAETAPATTAPVESAPAKNMLTQIAFGSIPTTSATASAAPAKPEPTKTVAIETASVPKPVLAEIAPTKAAQTQPAPAQSVPAETKPATKPAFAEIALVPTAQTQPASAKSIENMLTQVAFGSVPAASAPASAAPAKPEPTKTVAIETASIPKPVFAETLPPTAPAQIMPDAAKNIFVKHILREVEENKAARTGYNYGAFDGN